ncbi:MAG: DUF2914 domain-containing protein [Pseudomonadota bacterium]
MSPLSDEYLRSLEPETMRYDVTIFDDFVLSVLPNGLKTWAFLYEHEGRTRRKTLGVYPDMNYEAAEDALDHAREMILKLGDDIKDSPVEPDTPRVEVPPEAIVPPPAAPPPIRPAVLASRRQRRAHSSGPSYTITTRRSLSPKLLRIGGVAAAAVVLLGLAVFVLPRLGFLGGDTDASAGSPAPGEERAGRSAPRPISVDAPATPAPQTVPENAPEPAPSTPPAAEPTPVAAEPAPETLPDTPAAQSVAETAPTPITPEREPEPEPETVADVVAPEPVTPEPVTTQPAEAPAPPPEPAVEPPPQRVAVAQPDPAPALPAVPDGTDSTARAPAAPATTSGVIQVTPPDAATSAGGEVTRAIVTSGVENIEPVDDLGQDIALEGGGYRTVFYFTELRGFTAGNIVHRWTYNGRVIADVPLKVAGGWRWRTYSSKDLLPGMVGEWEVAVVDADGRVLGQQRFYYDR